MEEIKPTREMFAFSRIDMNIFLTMKLRSKATSHSN